MGLDEALEEIQKGVYFSFGYNSDMWTDDGYIYEWRFRLVDFNNFLNTDYDINIRGVLMQEGQKTLKNIKLLLNKGRGEAIFEDFCSCVDGYWENFY
ncbi:hypothetical protein [Helicobacter cappadocius]|uniref:Uncharacterized protein n=1 Tax=Helicobacter cappadocius TaxID=3063998 RepID=A0AA90PIQ4_9HELI|nr:MULTISPECIES: hypothetical protein [unclassified Helicobacter]MDO7252693.1 hypothetical protein [Helicobacter sp. faydin-H75]MDP2538561.1 hypothetical protein [Helicobacter sp. faydin-H76]